MQIVPPLYLLQTLVVFSEQGNLVQTAERLGLTQPTVSRQLQQLEELFAQPLFRTQGRNKVLTEYASAIVDELKARFQDLERVFQKIDQTFAQPSSIHLTIGGRKEVLDKHFSKVSFAGTLELQHLSGSDTVDSLKRGQIDIGITQQTFESLNYHGKKLFVDNTVLIVPKKWAHGISSAKEWTTKSFQYGVAAYSSDFQLLKDFYQNFRVENPSPVNSIIADWNSIENRVSQGRSWAIIPSGFISETRGYDVFSLGAHFPMIQFFIYYRKDLAKTPWMKALLGQVFESST